MQRALSGTESADTTIINHVSSLSTRMSESCVTAFEILGIAAMHANINCFFCPPHKKFENDKELCTRNQTWQLLKHAKEKSVWENAVFLRKEGWKKRCKTEKDIHEILKDENKKKEWIKEEDKRKVEREKMSEAELFLSFNSSSSPLLIRCCT